MEDIISNTVQIVKRPHPAGWENTAILQFKIKITEILEEKLSNTAIPQTPMSPFHLAAYFILMHIKNMIYFAFESLYASQVAHQARACRSLCSN